MLAVKNLSLTFDKEQLKNLSFKLKKGEIIGIVGKSGAGKTSLLRLLSGLEEPTSGNISFNGKIVEGPTTKLIPGHDEIQLVNQNFELDIYHTVEENIREKALHLPYAERDELVNELLDLIELTSIRKRKAHLLSGGEQQRLALARALALEPSILLLDEPFAHLDGRLREEITNYLQKLQKLRKLTIVIVSHDGSEILSWTDKIMYLNDGEIHRIDTPHNFYYHPGSLEEAELFGFINAVKKRKKTILFRPNEFELVTNHENSLKLKFIKSHFHGSTFLNYFYTNKKEVIKLIHPTSLEDAKEIIIKRRG